MKKIITIIGSVFLALLLVCSIFAVGISDTELPNTGVVTSSEQLKISSNSLDKNNIKSGEKSIFNLPQQTFVTSSASISEQGEASSTLNGKQCISQRASVKYRVYKGGLDSNNQPIRAGALCKDGEYINYLATFKIGSNTYYKALFNQLWIKTNDNDLMYYNQYSWSRDDIFNVNKIDYFDGYYYCYSCEAPVITGCQDTSATNYNPKATTGGTSSCVYPACERKSLYAVANGQKYYDSCDGTANINYFSCEGTKTKLTLVACEDTQECKGAICVNKQVATPETPVKEQVSPSTPIDETPAQETTDFVVQSYAINSQTNTCYIVNDETGYYTLEECQSKLTKVEGFTPIPAQQDYTIYFVIAGFLVTGAGLYWYKKRK